MMIKFRAGPAAQASTIPSFAGFDGLKRTCTKFEKVKGGVLRCAVFKKGRGHPVCDKRLVDGGRSPGLVRSRGVCPKGPSAKRRSPKRKSKR